MTLNDIYQLKITLIGTDVWRRVLVPAGMSLGQLHNVIQLAMGWEDVHLHEFRIGRHHYGLEEPGCLDERRFRLSDVLPKKGSKAEYTYDFGDGWEHVIRVEKLATSELGVVYPVCTGGRLEPPPEDCGGPIGYYKLLDEAVEPDPTRFSVDAVNVRLAPLRQGPIIARIM